MASSSVECVQNIYTHIIRRDPSTFPCPDSEVVGPAGVAGGPRTFINLVGNVENPCLARVDVQLESLPVTPLALK